MLIRHAVDSDANALQRFTNELMGEHLPVLFRRGSPPTVEEARAFIQHGGSSVRNVLFIADVEKEIVGLVEFHGDLRPQLSHVGSLGISVASSWRGLGVGSRLISRLLGWAPAAGIHRVELEVFANNPRAILFYQRRGFEREGRKTGAVEVDGQYIDMITMANVLARQCHA